MKTKHRFLTGTFIQVVLAACTLVSPLMCSASTGNAIYTNETIFNLTDTTQATLLITAGENNDVLAKVSYLGSKSTRTGHIQMAEFDDNPPISVAALQTRTFNIDLNNPAFEGGYGAVRVRSISPTGGTSAATFIAYLRENTGDTISAVSGLDRVGAQFDIPTINTQSQHLRIVVMVFGSGDFHAPVRIRESSPSGYDSTFQVGVLATFRWDSEELLRGRLANGFIRVESPVPIIVSIYYEHAGPAGNARKYHIHLRPNYAIY